MELNAKSVVVMALGFVIFIAGLGYYFGWWDNISDKIPWFADKGDLKVIVYDGNGTINTTDDTPLANVTVFLQGTEFKKTTDSNGTALFIDVEVGDYTVIAEYNSTQLSKNVTITKDSLTNVTFIFNSGQ